MNRKTTSKRTKTMKGKTLSVERVMSGYGLTKEEAQQFLAERKRNGAHSTKDKNRIHAGPGWML